MAEVKIDPNTEQPVAKVTNVARKKDKLLREMVRAHEWRVQVWAQMELKMRSTSAALIALGGEPYEPFEPQFNDEEALHHYASMTLSK